MQKIFCDYYVGKILDYLWLPLYGQIEFKKTMKDELKIYVVESFKPEINHPESLVAIQNTLEIN